jgi:hypothetical protein
MPRRLRPVGPDEKAVKPKRLTVAEAAAAGSHRDMLVALQGRVASAVASPSCPAVALAALARLLMQLSREVSVIDARAEDADDVVIPDEPLDGDAI